MLPTWPTSFLAAISSSIEIEADAERAAGAARPALRNQNTVVPACSQAASPWFIQGRAPPGHALFALLFGFVGGVVAKWFYLTRSPGEDDRRQGRLDGRPAVKAAP